MDTRDEQWMVYEKVERKLSWTTKRGTVKHTRSQPASDEADVVHLIGFTLRAASTKSDYYFY